MGKPQNKMDRPLLISVIVLVAFGFLIFSSASLGLLARDGASFSSVATGQIFLGIIGGSIALFLAARVRYRIYKAYALHIFLFAVFLMLLVFVPGINFSYGGATRWLDLGFTTFQPAEILKLAFVIYFAKILSTNRDVRYTFMRGFIPLVVLLGIVGILLLLQPDTGTFLIILSAGLAMYTAAGARWRDIGLFVGIAAIGLALLALLRGYVLERVLTFFKPTADLLGSGWQVNQSLIAVGSGQVFGRGFGQSVQKFGYLPEPIGDSIFAVFAEEFGFAGALVLIMLFLFFALRGMRIAARAPDQFGGLVVVGIVILIVSQSFINMASLIGIFPLTGLPLLFVSHGGSALLFALVEVGIILNVSRYTKL